MTSGAFDTRAARAAGFPAVFSISVRTVESLDVTAARRRGDVFAERERLSIEAAFDSSMMSRGIAFP